MIIALAESMKQLRFFSRWNAAVDYRLSSVMMVTAKYSIARSARQQGIPVHLVAARSAAHDPVPLHDTIDVIQGEFSESEASAYYHAFATTLRRLTDSGTVDLVTVWGGGNTVAARAMTDGAAAAGIPRLFIDRSSIPGMLFADPEGTNDRSYLYSHTALLDAHDPDERAYTAVIGRFQDTSAVVTSDRDHDKNWLLPIDIISSFRQGIPYRGIRGLLRSLIASFTRPPSDLLSGGSEVPKRFILFPLSHSYEYERSPAGFSMVLDGISQGRALSREHGIPLLITFHPDESDRRFIHSVHQAGGPDGILYSRIPSRFLLTSAVTVIAHQTGAALEAMVMGIPVVHLGRSIYALLDERKLRNFITRYLLPIDPKSTQPFTADEVRALKERSVLQ